MSHRLLTADPKACPGPFSPTIAEDSESQGAHIILPSSFIKERAGICYRFQIHSSIRVRACMSPYSRKSESRRTFLPSATSAPWDPTQVMRLGSKYLYLPSHHLSCCFISYYLLLFILFAGPSHSFILAALCLKFGLVLWRSGQV